MKTIISLLVFAMFVTNISFSNVPGYKIGIENQNRISESVFEFDIRLYNTDPENAPFHYALGQYFLEFNQAIANGGELSYSIVTSDLPENMRPRNASVNGNLLRLAINQISSDRKNLPQIEKNEKGILVARMRLETSAKSFSSNDPILRLASGKSLFRTKVFSLKDNLITELVNTEIAVDNPETENSQTETESTVPTEYSLEQNFPNPFNPATKIQYALPLDSRVTIKVYDNTGREITTLLNDVKAAGRYELSFNATNLPSGVYYARIQANKFVKVIKMMLIK